MPKIPDDIIRRVQDAAKIEDVVSDCGVTLRKAGVNLTGLCPFHDDKHDGNFIVRPSTVSAKRGGNTYHCFVCMRRGEGGGPVDFLMKHERLSFPDAIRWLGKKYCIEVDNVPVNYTPPPPRPKPAPLPMLALPMAMVESREQGREQNTLVNWLRTGIRWDATQRRRIDEVLKAYHVGHARQGHTIFWQIDNDGIVRTGKMMLYRPDGHRDRKARYGFDWIHASLARGIPKRDEQGNILRDEEGKVIYDNTVFKHIYDEDKQEAKPTLFGLHLLDRYGKLATVNIVESEKTALIMAIAYGNHTGQVWMACGGLEMLNRERLKPIIQQHRRIVLYPDRDGINRWRAKLENLRYDRMHLNAEPVLNWWREEDGPKADVADVVVRIINNAKPSIEPLTEQPEVKNLMEKLDLKEVNNEEETETH